MSPEGGEETNASWNCLLQELRDRVSETWDVWAEGWGPLESQEASTACDRGDTADPAGKAWPSFTRSGGSGEAQPPASSAHAFRTTSIQTLTGTAASVTAGETEATESILA